MVLILFLSGCNSVINNVSAEGIPSPTALQSLTAIASDTAPSDSASTPTAIPAPTDVMISPVTAVPAVDANALNPLTGLPPSDPMLLNRRPLAIKVAIFPRYMRPQSGLSLADQAFEYYIEDGLTRFIAVFYGNDSEWVGPVRSGRYFDENVQRMYHAYLVFKFADPRELGYFKGSDFSQFLLTPTIGRCPPFRFLPEREATVEAYNNSYFDTVRWAECVAEGKLENNKPFLREGFFSDQPPLATLTGTKISTYYSVDSYNYWLYNSQDQQYYRYQEISDTRDGKPESYEPVIDRVTNQHVHASNVVVILAYHAFNNPYDHADQVYDIDLKGSGEAYVFRDGVGMPATWVRANADQPLIFIKPDGTIIPMKRGVTFYEVMGTRSFVDQGGGEWNFHHDPP